MTTLRQMGAKIGSRVRFIEDPDGQWRTVKTDAELDYEHLLPWVVENRTMSDDLAKQAREWREDGSPQEPFYATGRLIDAMADRIEELEAKLAKAVKAMEFWSQAQEPEIDAAINLMQTTLAELKGEDRG